MKINNLPCVVTIAGTDPSGGAGIQADIKAISATGCYAASVITALVAQNTLGVQAIQEVSPTFIEKQIESVFSDLDIAAVKIGMLHNKEVIIKVVNAIKKFKPPIIVLDPVMVAKNGSELLQLDVVDFLKTSLFPQVSLITPNLFEAEKLINQSIKTFTDMEWAAKKLSEEFNINVLMKGGHLENAISSDVLYHIDEAKHHWFHAERVSTRNTHGTGCSLSSAIASYLAQGRPIKEAISVAKNYLTLAIQSGSHFKIGQGYGPIDHFYFLRD